MVPKKHLLVDLLHLRGRGELVALPRLQRDRPATLRLDDVVRALLVDGRGGGEGFLLGLVECHYRLPA